MLDKSAKVVDAARKKGLLIVHAPITFSDNYRELPDEPYGILAGCAVMSRSLRSSRLVPRPAPPLPGA